jgi:prepilin-type processing-associated H-X9-DG protein
MLGTKRGRSGFTLVELLVVISVVMLLLALLMPAVQAAREGARHARCGNNLKQIGVALESYHTVYHTYPDGAITYQQQPLDCNTPKRGHSLFTMILPFNEQKPAYDAINFAFASHDLQGTENAGAINYTGLSPRVAVYICPSDYGQTQVMSTNAYSWSSYAGCVGTIDIFRWYCGGCYGQPLFRDNVVCLGDIELSPDGVFGNNHGFPHRAIRDGLSMTLLIGEFARFADDPDPPFNQWSSALWYQSYATGVTRPQGLATAVPRINASMLSPDYPSSNPITWKYDATNAGMGQFGFRSRHPGGANFLFADGSVHFLKETIDLKGVYWALSTRNGRELISADSY